MDMDVHVHSGTFLAVTLLCIACNLFMELG